uniref:Uncharacterized protein n=1 Tax=Arundo donax TaxID=35708 RepID=A0A0A9C9G7_ARUDO
MAPIRQVALRCILFAEHSFSGHIFFQSSSVVDESAKLETPPLYLYKMINVSQCRCI